MSITHRLLQRQVRKWLADHDTKDLEVFLSAVDAAYHQADADRALVERSLELSSTELTEANQLLLGREVQLRAQLTRIQAMQQQLVAQEKLASLGGLTAGIAHEIKNPLNFITNFAEASSELLAELRGLMLPGQATDAAEVEELLGLLDDNLQTVVRHARRADGIVRGMLQHARGRTAAPESVDLNAVVAEYADLAFHGHRARRPDAAVDLCKQLSDQHPRILGVPAELGRVLLNLVGNALEACTPESASGPRGYVTVQTDMQGDQAVVRVLDNGPGIPASLAAKVFEPFFTTKPAGSGTGLGLSISHDIIQSHGGTLRLMAQSGASTCFEVTLPDATAPARASGLFPCPPQEEV
jgi:two-component system NtrC family sensor kinase